MTTFVSTICCWLNWGFGLIAGALLARAVARRVKDVDYPLLIASAYSGFVIWHAGLSGSIPLQIGAQGGTEILGVNYYAGIDKQSGGEFAPDGDFFVLVDLLIKTGQIPLLLIRGPDLPDIFKSFLDTIGHPYGSRFRYLGTACGDFSASEQQDESHRHAPQAGEVFDPVLTVQGILRFVPGKPPLVGRFIADAGPKHLGHFLGDFDKLILRVPIIKIFQIDGSHYKPPFRCWVNE